MIFDVSEVIFGDLFLAEALFFEIRVDPWDVNLLFSNDYLDGGESLASKTFSCHYGMIGKGYFRCFEDLEILTANGQLDMASYWVLQETCRDCFRVILGILG